MNVLPPPGPPQPRQPGMRRPVRPPAGPPIRPPTPPLDSLPNSPISNGLPSPSLDNSDMAFEFDDSKLDITSPDHVVDKQLQIVMDGLNIQPKARPAMLALDKPQKVTMIQSYFAKQNGGSRSNSQSNSNGNNSDSSSTLKVMKPVHKMAKNISAPSLMSAPPKGIVSLSEAKQREKQKLKGKNHRQHSSNSLSRIPNLKPSVALQLKESKSAPKPKPRPTRHKKSRSNNSNVKNMAHLFESQSSEYPNGHSNGHSNGLPKLHGMRQPPPLPHNGLPKARSHGGGLNMNNMDNEYTPGHPNNPSNPSSPRHKPPPPSKGRSSLPPPSSKVNKLKHRAKSDEGQSGSFGGGHHHDYNHHDHLTVDPVLSALRARSSPSDSSNGSNGVSNGHHHNYTEMNDSEYEWDHEEESEAVAPPPKPPKPQKPNAPKTTNLKVKLKIGSPVEVYSNSQQCWIDGQIMKIKGKLLCIGYGPLSIFGVFCGFLYFDRF